MRGGLIVIALPLAACAEPRAVRRPVTMVPIEPHAPEPGGEVAPASQPSGLVTTMRAVERDSPSCRLLAGGSCFEGIDDACRAARCGALACVTDDGSPAQVACALRPIEAPAADDAENP